MSKKLCWKGGLKLFHIVHQHPFQAFVKCLKIENIVIFNKNLIFIIPLCYMNAKDIVRFYLQN